MQGRKPVPVDLPATTPPPPPLLAVIIANYNYGLYIRECLDSILNQTFKNLEIIHCNGKDVFDSMNAMDAAKNYAAGNHIPDLALFK